MPLKHLPARQTRTHCPRDEGMDKAMDIQIPLTDVTLGEEEAAAAARVVRSGWVTMGEEVKAFEGAFAEALGARHAIAITNGTAALHLAYEAAGLGEGDEFLVPALTFVATMNAGLYLRARPVLVDCAGEDDLTLSPQDLARKITPRTRLIVTMAYGGYAPDMDGIMELARAHGIAVVEDVCHAPLARLGGKCLGTFGDAGAFSFFGNKNLSIGEGGMITTNRDDLAQRIRLMRSHGMTTLTWDRHRGHASEYDVVSAGYNYRMDEIRAAIGREQLKKLPLANEQRRSAAGQLREKLLALGVPGLKIPFSAPRGQSVHHLFVILLPEGVDRAAFRVALRACGIQTSIHYPPLDQFTVARNIWLDRPPELPVVRALAGRLVTLPMSSALTQAQMDSIAGAVGEALRNP